MFVKTTILLSLLFIQSFAYEKTENFKTYSLEFPTEERFLVFLQNNQFTEESIGEIYSSCDASPKNSFICAMAYDYGYGERGQDIEDWYQIAADSNVHIGAKSARVEYADYMIRQGEAGDINSYFKAGECYTQRYRGPCFYYLGMARYLTDKNCRYLFQAKREGTKKLLIERLCN